ncbi:MAG: homoserine dehydrogenase [Geminicoccaceae bacterium]
MLPSHSIAEQLAERAAAGQPVTVALAGAGQMGTDIVCQIMQMKGLRLGAVADLSIQYARAALRIAGIDDEQSAVAKNGDEANAIIESGRIALVEDARILPSIGLVDALIDATGHPSFGAELTLESFRCGKHMVMMNVECDVTIGRHLAAEAARAGVVYTGAAGDEPACTIELIRFARDLGMTVVAAGKGKNNPLNPDAVPADYEEEARRREMNPRMLVEFVDGSKTMIEMVAIANATGLTIDVPGMHGPAATLDELASTLCHKDDGGVLTQKGVVDYSIGKGVAPGVFCIVEMGHARLTERMIDLKVGKGPCFTLHRPFHLTSMEVPLSAVRAVLFNRPDMCPLDHPVADVATMAKRDLVAGERLGKIGEAEYRGWALTAADGRKQQAIPLGLAENATVTAPVKKGELLTYANCRPDDTLAITRIRQEMDRTDAD